jgi:nitrite reductase/ring-hydroxylating ferredoxin subunit
MPRGNRANYAGSCNQGRSHQRRNEANRPPGVLRGRCQRRWRFFAFTDTCPHDGASLSLGSIEGTVLTCAKDGSQFDLNSGNVVKGPAFKRIRTYRLQIKGDELYI